MRLSSPELEACWDDLADTDAAKRYRAVHALVLAPPEQVVPLLRERLQNQVAVWIRDLDSNEFDVRPGN